MKLVKLAAGVVNQTPLDWDRNQQNLLSCIETARQRGVSLLCLPELCLTGYGCEDAFYSPGVSQTALELLDEIAPATAGMAVSLGLPLLVDGSLYNVACLAVDGKLAGFVAKQHLAGDGIHYEPRWFKPWPAGIRTTYRWQGQDLPLGDFFFEVEGVRIGFEICEDAWVGERPGAELSQRGVDVLLNPSASHFAFGKHAVRRRFVLEGSRAFQVSYVYANLVGNESGRAIFDGDAMIASRGRLLASGPRFSYRDALLTTAVVDIEMTRMERSRVSSFQPDPRAAEQYRHVVEGSWQVPPLEGGEGDVLVLKPLSDSPEQPQPSGSRIASLASHAPREGHHAGRRDDPTGDAKPPSGAGQTVVAEHTLHGGQAVSPEQPPVVLLPEDEASQGGTDPPRFESPLPADRGAESQEEEFTRAVSLALFDYVRKSRSRGVVISLSGGADSAAVAVLSRLMLEFSARELGTEAARGKLSGTANVIGAEGRGGVTAGRESEPFARWGTNAGSTNAGSTKSGACSERATEAGLTEAEHPLGKLSPKLDDWAREILLTVYQATAHSSSTTREAAEAVANEIAAEHLMLEIDGLVTGYRERIEAALGRELTWEQDDIALQNIQARTRSPSVWMLANLRGALLLSTSNRSEAAVGYATMDGDTSGGLSPIAGIDKAFLRRWLRWMETTGPAELGPLPPLRAINAQQPTAELRPLTASQTDEDDLMPYDVLDAIERWAIRDKRMPAEVDRLLAAARPHLPRTQRVAWIKRFYQLWCRNQWKRERYAPSFHLDDENLDPKTWCRFPILSGGFRRELLALERSRAEAPAGSLEFPE